MVELSEACRKHLAARWDDGGSMDDDRRFRAVENNSLLGLENSGLLNVIDLDIEDMADFPELRGYTAVAISQDGSVAYLTKEEPEEDDE